MKPVSEAERRALMNLQPVEWPLKFKSHSFGVRCFDTLTCSVRYAGFEYGIDEPSPSSSRFGSDYLDGWAGAHGGIRNFPGKADVAWRPTDGIDHRAEIDIAAIFHDEIIRHNVSQEDIPELPDGRYRSEPSILLEVNGHAIRIYMRAFVPTRQCQTPGNPYSGMRYDLIMIKSFRYVTYH